MLLGHIDLVNRRMVRGWAADTDRPTESITLSFGKFEFDYQPSKPDGSLGPVASVGWDIVTAKQV